MFKKYKTTFIEHFTRNDYDKMVSVYISTYGKKPYCELLEVIMLIFDIERVENKRWYFLLEKKYATGHDEKKIL